MFGTDDGLRERAFTSCSHEVLDYKTTRSRATLASSVSSALLSIVYHNTFKIYRFKTPYVLPVHSRAVRTTADVLFTPANNTRLLFNLSSKVG